MKTRHLILLLLEKHGGQMESKTKLQKEVYFVSLLLKRDSGFKAHYYGPFSPVVEQGLDELVGAGFVEARRELFGVSTGPGFEFKRYSYSLTKSGSRFATVLAEEHASEAATIEDFVGKLREIGNPDYLSLSIAAKAYFILEAHGGPMKLPQIREKALKFGWDVGEREIGTASEILKKLGFARET
jgi:uncharacterized protein YwgA